MTKFEIGKNYKMGCIGDHSIIWTYIVLARTAKTVTLWSDHGEVKRCRIREYAGAECVDPLGRYSMSPILSADNPV